MNAAEICAMLGENVNMSVNDLSEEQQTAINAWKRQSADINAQLSIADPTDPSEPVPNPVPEPDDRPRDPKLV